MSHTILQRGPKDFTCTVCGQSWVSESKGYCPGVTVYPYGAWGTLMTKNQLSAKGFSVTPATLPEPVGAYRRVKEADYVMLYDQTQAQAKKSIKRTRITYYLESLLWPYSQLSVLDEWRAMEYGKFEPSERSALIRTISEMAVCLGAFAPHEAAALTDGAMLTLNPAMTVHRQYGRQGFWGEREKLVERVTAAYGRFLWTPKLMDEAVVEFHRRKSAAKEEEREAARRAQRLAEFERMGNSLIDDVIDTPAVQRSLFDEKEV